MASTHFGGPIRVGDAVGKGTSKGSFGSLTSDVYVYRIVPTAIVATGVAAAQAVAGAGNLTINGTLATGGVATLDVPRAVSILSTNAGDTTQTATVYGTDGYGVPTVETIAFNGTTGVSGKKAFKTVTRVAISAVMTGNATVATTDVFGLPYRADDRGTILTAWASAFVTTGTFAAAVTTSPATATTGDVRGTYNVPSAADAAKILYVWQFIADNDTNNGLYGVDQFGG